MTRYIVVSVVALCLAPLAATAGSTYPRAERNYDTYCVQCHGMHRNGKGLNAAHMSVQPRDHTDAKAMGDVPDEEMFKAIKEGLKKDGKTLMKPTKDVNDQQIKDLVAYMRKLKKD